MGLAFVASVADAELRQGEIISGMTRFDFDSQSGAIQPIPIDFCITLNQDCDLLQDFAKRTAGDAGTLAHILLAAAQLGAPLKKTTDNDIWRRISQNQDMRYQTFSSIPQEDDLDGAGIECLIVDFKSIFSMPSEEVYRQIAGPAKRRSCLADLYRENFQLRIASYLSRVMLPEPHRYSKPAVS